MQTIFPSGASPADFKTMLTHFFDVMSRIGNVFPFKTLNYTSDGITGTFEHEDGKTYRIVVTEVRDESV